MGQTALATGIASDEIHLRRLIVALLAALRRQIRLIGALVLAFLLLGIAYIVATPSAYTARTSVLIDLKQPNLYNGNQGLALALVDPAAVDSQVEILKSEALALQVIRKLDLTGREDEIASPSILKMPIRWIFSLLSSSDPSEYSQERALVSAVMSQTSVQRQGTTYLVHIDFEALNPALAAEISNGIAEAYMAGQIDARYETTRQANVWLEQRVEELRERVLKAEQSVSDYRTDNNLVQSEGVFLNERELSELNSQLLIARAATAEKRARVEQINTLIETENPDALSADTLESPILADLRKQYSKLGLRELMLTRRLNGDQSGLDLTKREKQDLTRQMMTELRRVGDAARSDLVVAQSRQASLEESLQAVKKDNASDNEKMVRLRELDRQAAATRTLYENFLGRLRQTDQDASFPIAEARVVTPATRPLRASSPRILRVLAFAGGLGALLGIGIALVRDRFDNVVRSSWELENLTGLPMLGIIPVLSGQRPVAARGVPFARKIVPTLVGRGEEGRKADFTKGAYPISRDPMLRANETMRVIKAALQGHGDGAPPKVICAVSALPQEGKSLTNLLLAKHLACTGKRVALIDADFRRSSLTREGERARSGLVQVVRGEAALPSVMRADEATGLHVLPAGRVDSSVQSDELLRSADFRALIETMVRAYDYVIVDLPPLLAAVDARVAASVIDRFIYVVEWEQTPRDAILQALHISPLVTSKMVGAVMNKVQLDMLHLYDDAAVYAEPYGQMPALPANEVA